MEKILEIAAATQAALDEMNTKCERSSTLQDSDTCRQRWDMQTEMERLMRLYHEVKDSTGR